MSTSESADRIISTADESISLQKKYIIQIYQNTLLLVLPFAVAV